MSISELRLCENCGGMSDYHLSPKNGEIICYGCGKPMLQASMEVLPEGNTGSPNAIAEPVIERSILNTIVKPIFIAAPLSLNEMQKNIEKAKGSFEKLESQLSKLRRLKAEAIASNDNEKVISLSKETDRLSKETDASYGLWQNAKKNYEFAILDRENQIIAENLLSEYSVKADIRASKGNEMLNSLRQLSDLIGRVSELAGEFQGMQLISMNDSQKLLREFKRLNIYRIAGTETPIIRADNYGSIRAVRENLQKETGLLESRLLLIENIIQSVRKSCSFDLLQQG